MNYKGGLEAEFSSFLNIPSLHGHFPKQDRFLALGRGVAGVVLWQRLSSRLGVYEIPLLGAFHKLSFVDEFRKLARPCSGLLAPSVGQRLTVHRNERSFVR